MLLCVLTVLTVVAVRSGGARAQDGAADTSSMSSKSRKITFIRSFPGSEPEYIRVTASRDGAGIFQEGTIADPGPEETFEITQETVDALFSLAEQLNYFRGLTLESGRAVAQMGEKVFQVEAEGEDSGDSMDMEVRYNHTVNATALELQSRFESIARSQHYLWVLPYKARFDRLGVADTLRRFDNELSSGKISELDSLIPVLRALAGDLRLMKLARNHAERLAVRIENKSAMLELEFGSPGENRFVRVQVNESGEGTVDIRRFDESPDPKELRLPSALNLRLWELAELSDGFGTEQSRLPTGGHLAGYRLTYEKGTTKNVVAFSSPRSGVLAEVINILQRVITQQYHLRRLREAAAERSLMLQVVLQELRRSVRKRELADPDEFLPVLEEIAGGDEFHELDRGLATKLVRDIKQIN